MNMYAIPRSSRSASLETVGGKGLSLAKMIQAGFPVPDGFHVTADAYQAFKDEHAVVAVRSSAIAYRIKNKIDQNCVALAVVVQEMVNAEAAGILFAANPININGRRDELVVNAAWGLGEPIVRGLVSPDSIVADKTTGKVKKYQASEKTVIIMVTESGTRQEPLDDARRKSRVLKEAFARHPEQSGWVK